MTDSKKGPTRKGRMLPFAATVHHAPIPDFAATVHQRSERPQSIVVDVDGESDWARARQRAQPVARLPETGADIRPTLLLGNLEAVRAPLRGALEDLLDRCAPITTADAVDASGVVLVLGDDPDWATTRPPSSFAGPRVVWSSGLRREAFYEAAQRQMPEARFLHGAQGIEAIEHLLEQHGAVVSTTALDVGAQDALQRLRRAYLRSVPDELDAFLSAVPPEGRARTAAWTDFLQRLIGTSGTYGLLRLCDTARVALEQLGAGGPGLAWEGEVLTSLRHAAAAERVREPSLVLGESSAIELGVLHRVLVVADEDALANQLVFALSDRQLEVVVERDPATLVERVGRVQPDAVVLQTDMARFDGLDLARQLRSLRACAAIPLLAVLSDPQDAAFHRAARSLVDGTLVRPFTAATAQTTVMAALHRVEIARELGGRDPVTGLYTRRTTRDRLEVELVRARRGGQLVGLLLAHVTESPGAFRRDTFTQLARACHRGLRATDVLGRFNERTLCAVVPGVDVRAMNSLLDRLRRELEGVVSFEIAASVAEGNAPPDALLADAEQRLTQRLAAQPVPAVGRYAGVVETRPDAGEPRILVVDRDAAIVNLLQFFCTRDGLRVDSCNDGPSALAALEAAEAAGRLPDLMLVDTHLTGLGGMGVLDTVSRRYGGRLPVIVTTVTPSPSQTAEALRLGAVDVVAKPFAITELMARLRAVLVRAGAL